MSQYYICRYTPPIVVQSPMRADNHSQYSSNSCHRLSVYSYLIPFPKNDYSNCNNLLWFYSKNTDITSVTNHQIRVTLRKTVTLLRISYFTLDVDYEFRRKYYSNITQGTIDTCTSHLYSWTTPSLHPYPHSTDRESCSLPSLYHRDNGYIVWVRDRSSWDRFPSGKGMWGGLCNAWGSIVKEV